MKNLRSIKLTMLVTTAAMVIGMAGARAQVPSLQPPYNVDIGAVIKMTAQAAGTINSPSGVSNYTTTPLNLVWDGITCTFVGSAPSGSPSVVWSIQQFDAATNSYLTLLSQTVAYANLPGPNVLEVAPGIAVSSLPTNMAAINLKAPRVWRVSLTVGGTLGPAESGTVGCNLTR